MLVYRNHILVASLFSNVIHLLVNDPLCSFDKVGSNNDEEIRSFINNQFARVNNVYVQRSGCLFIKKTVGAGLWNSLWFGSWTLCAIYMRSTLDTGRDLASRRFVVDANFSSCVAEMSNFDTDELGRIVANAVSNFLNRSGQNSKNSTSARPTATQMQTS